MLSELSIKNFAIIESLSLSFTNGLTVLTGETGAGKSIIIDAIGLLVGGRGSAEFVRHGAKKAEIEGLFQFENIKEHPSYEKARQFGIDVEDEMLILRREIFHTGKSVCRINGKLVTISVLREIGSTLVDIHGQHEHQELMDETRHLPLLDHFGGEEIAEALKSYESIYRSYQRILKSLRELTENEQQMAHRLDLLSFQLDEIEKAQLTPGEDDKLLEEKNRLQNFHKIYEALQVAYSSLQGEHAGLDWLGHAMSNLQEAGELDSSYQNLAETVANCFYVLEDAAREIRNELDLLEFDPARLDEIEDRLAEINRLKRKYGKTIDEILEYAATIEEELETLKNKEFHIDKLEKELSSCKEELSLAAKELSEIRQKHAARLTDLIHKELKDLYMDKTVFDVMFTSDYEQFNPSGSDQVEFYISTNPGEPLKPLSKIASGGELSRIMLALKSIFSKHQGITSIIFDEVDTGVGGRVAQAIGEKIYRLSVHSQVLCITHLPQVAAMADNHYYIAKKVAGGRTVTSVQELDETERITEIARMISGAEITAITKEHAGELLQMAKELKLSNKLS